MRNPQILGARLPRGTYWLLPGGDTANSGTEAGANSGTNGEATSGTGGAYHLTLNCLGRMLPFVLDFQGSALVLVVRLFSCTHAKPASFTSAPKLLSLFVSLAAP